MSKRNIVKPTGLKGTEKLSRMKQLMGVTPINESINRSVIELTKNGPDGNIYAIVRENQEYYIKSCKNKKNVISEDFKYIGGLQNKKSKSYPSYAKAIKHLNLKFISLNEAHSKSGNINTFENDNILDEHHAIATDKAFSETKPMDKNISKEYIVNKKGSKLSYDNKKGKEKDGFGDNVADKDAIDELEDVKLNETERLIDKFLVESILDGDLENKIFEYMSIIKGMRPFGMGQKRNWTEVKRSEIFKDMHGEWDMDISDEDKIKYEELDFEGLNKLTSQFLEIVNALDEVDETSYDSFKQLQSVLDEFRLNRMQFESQLMSIRYLHKEMWGNVGSENRSGYDSREGTYPGNWFIELSSQLAQKLNEVVYKIEKDINYNFKRRKDEDHIRENTTKETLTVGKLNNYITEMFDDDEYDHISHAKQSGESSYMDMIWNTPGVVEKAKKTAATVTGVPWDTLHSEEKDIFLLDAFENSDSGIDEMIDEPTHPDYFDKEDLPPEELQNVWDEEAENREKQEDERWEEEKAEADADAYLSSVEAHEDPDHVQSEYGFGESILKKGSIVERLSGILKKKGLTEHTKPTTGLFEDEEDGYNLDEETSYKIKLDAPSSEPDFDASDEEEDFSLDSLEDSDEGSDNDKPFDDDEPFDPGVEADEEEDPEKFIQQLAGKIGTSLRTYTKDNGEPDFDLEKYVINSVISATHTAEMDKSDQKDIIEKIKTSGDEDEDEDLGDDEFDDDLGGDDEDLGGEEDEDLGDDEDGDTEENLEEMYKMANVYESFQSKNLDKSKKSRIIVNKGKIEHLIKKHI